VVNKPSSTTILFPSFQYDVKDVFTNYLCGLLLDQIELHQQIVITIDKRSRNKLVREDLKNYLVKKIHEKNNNSVELFQVDSYTSYGLQVVDFIAWAINRKFNLENGYYYDIIEKRIINKEYMEVWK